MSTIIEKLRYLTMKSKIKFICKLDKDNNSCIFGICKERNYGNLTFTHKWSNEYNYIIIRVDNITIYINGKWIPELNFRCKNKIKQKVKNLWESSLEEDKCNKQKIKIFKEQKESKESENLHKMRLEVISKICNNK